MNANRQALREGEVLLRGDVLVIPLEGEGTDEAGIDESDLQDEDAETAGDSPPQLTK